MAAFNITADDRDLILRAVATEVDHKLAKSNPVEYQRQVAGVVDTIVNRAASGQFGDSIEAVLNAKNQFSAINGPRGRGYTVYGSVRNVPDSKVPSGLSTVVNGWLNERIAGAPSSIGGGLHYANPNASDKNNLAWINALEGPRYGVGKSIHYHGTTAGYRPFEAVITGDFYNGQGIKLPPGEIPTVGTMLDVIQGGRYGPVNPDAVPGTPQMPGKYLDSLGLKEGPKFRRFLPELPPSGTMDNVGAGATRADLNKLRGVDQAYPVSQTKRPRPESYAGMERGETPGMVSTQSKRRNASPAEMMAFQSLGQSAADGPLVSTRRSQPVRSIADLAEIYSQGGPTRPGTNAQRAPSLVSSLLDSASDVPMLSSISRAPRIQNLTPGIDTTLLDLNDYTSVTNKDTSRIYSIAEMMWGDEFTTELPGGTRKRIPSAGLVGEQNEPMPAGATTRAGSTRPASLLAAITGGNSTTWNAAQDGPAKRVGSLLTRKEPVTVPTNGGYAGQERGEMVRTPNQGTMTASNTPGIFRIAGLNGTAGNVGLPNGVRPNVDIPSFTEDFATTAPNPRPWTRVGAEAMSPDIFKPTPKPTALERKPNPFEFVPPPTGLTKPQPTGQQGNQGLTAVSNVPQFRTVMQTERYENPAYKTWKANQNATRDDIPLGEMVYGARSRDSVAQAAAGQNFVNTQMPERWLTRQVPVKVPIAQPQPVATPKPVVAPVVAPVVQPVVGPKPNPLQQIWRNPVQGLLGAIAPAGGPVSSLLQSLARPPSEYFLTATGFLDDGISENHRTPSIGVMK